MSSRKEKFSGMRSIFGTLLIVLGVFNIIDFWAPRPIPTVGPSAFIVGLLCIGAGIYLRAKRDANGRIRWDALAALFKPVQGTGGNRGQDTTTRQARDVDPLMAVRVLRFAERQKGVLTVAKTAMELDVPIDDAEAAMDECVSKGSAYIDVDRKTGIPSYHFPEFERSALPS